MPIWAELMIVMIVAYVIGIGIGWAIWGRGENHIGRDGVSGAASTATTAPQAMHDEANS